MFTYRNYEVVISEHFGSVVEDGHSVFCSHDKPFYRAQCQFGIIYAITELAARQEIIALVDKSLQVLYPS
jgi:hypothetical protein